MADGVTFGVSDVAALGGVTIRTLHHYDEAGLLVPSSRTEAGYRRYTAADLERLRAILVYRELGLGLVDIASALDAQPQDRVAMLERQHSLLVRKRIRTEQMIEAIEAAIAADRSGVEMPAKEMFEVFGDFDPKDHEAEAATRWPDAFEVSRQRTSRYGAEQWQEAIAEADSVSKRFAELLASGARATSESAMDLAEEHRASIDRWYYPCSKEMHAGLATSYVADPRFHSHWEAYGHGVAQYVHDSIVANSAR